MTFEVSLGCEKKIPNICHEAMVIRQPSINITKFPHFFVSTITNLVNSLNLTYEQLLEFRIQGKQVRSENNPSEVATFDLDKKKPMDFHILTTHMRFKGCATIQQEF